MRTKNITAIVTAAALLIGPLTLLPAASNAVAAATTTVPAALSWSPFSALSSKDSVALSAQIIVDPNGRATAVWRFNNGLTEVIQASSSQSGGAWTAPDTISDPTKYSSDPQITVDATGRTTAVWQSTEGENYVIQANTASSGGLWKSSPDTISDATYSSYNPQIIADSSGRTTSVWSTYIRPNRVIQANSSQSGETWKSTPDTISDPTVGGDSPQITVDTTDHLTVVWMSKRDGDYKPVILASTSPSGEPWPTTPDTLSDPTKYSSQPHIAAGADGRVTVVWQSSVGERNVIQANTSLSGDSWSTAPNTISDPAKNSLAPQIAAGASGRTTAVWQSDVGTDESVIQANTSQSGGPWSATPDTISDSSGLSTYPQIAVGSDGRASAVWGRYDDGNQVIKANTSPNGGGWGTIPDTLSNTNLDSGYPQVTLDSTGAAIALWSSWNNNKIAIYSRSSMRPFSTSAALAITGSSKVGQTLTAHMSRWWTWEPTPTTLTYAWRRTVGGSVLGTEETYTPSMADTGATLFVTVTAERPGYLPAEVSSTTTATVVSGTFSITGTAQVGTRLTAPTGTWPVGTTLTYSWKRSGVTKPISTNASYTPVVADIGKKLTVTVTAKRTGASTITATSAATTAVLGQPFTTSPVPTITMTGAGTPVVGTKLTAEPGTWSPSSATFSYVWSRAATPTGTKTVIPRATLKTYTAVDADRGMYLTVSVTAKKTGFANTTRTSADDGTRIGS